MTNPRDALLAEAARLLENGARSQHGYYGDRTSWLARYEAERAEWGMVLQLPDPELRLRVAAMLQLHWRKLTEDQLDAIKELVERDIAARAAPATTGKDGAK